VPHSGTSVYQAKIRAFQYWNTDGLPLIISGFAFILQGAAYFWEHHHRRSILPVLLIVLAVVILVDQIFRRKIAGWLKSRITYPRTGYAAPPPLTLHTDPALLSPKELSQQRKTKWIWVWLPPVLVLSLYLSFMYQRWYYALAAFLLAGLVGFLVVKQKLAWYTPLPSVLCGILLVLLPMDSHDTMSLGLTGIGIQIFVLGLAVLVRYLRQHPVPQA
jgi:hypothetical protein